jgi:hypothetical protein
MVHVLQVHVRLKLLVLRWINVTTTTYFSIINSRPKQGTLMRWAPVVSIQMEITRPHLTKGARVDEKTNEVQTSLHSTQQFAANFSCTFLSNSYYYLRRRICSVCTVDSCIICFVSSGGYVTSSSTQPSFAL